MDACPPLEDIAAFLDDTLSPEERERIAEHLARCESCYEVFAGAAHFELEEGSSADDIGRRDVLPFPLAQEKNQEKDQEKNQETKARVEPTQTAWRTSWWLPLAASVVLAAGLGYMIWQRSQVLPEVTVAGVVEPVQGNKGVGDALYQPEVERGGPGATAVSVFGPSEFLAGVYLVDLRLSIEAGEAADANESLRSVSSELDEMAGLISPEAAAFFKGRIDRIKEPADLDLLAQELPRHESALENELAQGPFFRFGIWTEAARVSAEVKSPAFFKEPRNRRFLALIPRELPADDEQYRPILSSLQKIEPLWDGNPRDYEALALHFKSIIDQFDRIKREGQEGLGLDLLPESVGEPSP